MEGTHFSSIRDHQEEPPIHHSRKHAGCHILPLQAKTQTTITRPESSTVQLKLQQKSDELEGHEDCSRVHASDVGTRQQQSEAEKEERKETGRERLKRHREEVGGKVMIPERWGEEGRLMDWIDYSSFDKLLAPTGLSSARQALVAEGRRAANTHGFRIETWC